MSRLVLCDLDHTLIASPRCEPTPEGIVAWESDIIANPPPPIPGAIEGLRRAIQAANGSCALITARSERMRAATDRWMFVHASDIVYASLSMGLDGQDSGGRVYKAVRIARLVEWTPRPIDLFDDDHEMRHALRPSDRFHHAPGCWR